MRYLSIIIAFIFSIFSLFFSPCYSRHLSSSPSLSSSSSIHLPLSINSTIFVDSLSNPVRLTCTNWPSHMETKLPEGLQFNSIKNIVGLIKSLGFNCVRYTYSIDFAAHTDTQSLTVYQTLINNNVSMHISGITKNNPHLINATLIQVFNKVMTTLLSSNIMVILDNHVSHASWCCSNTDGNGWFNQGYFNTDEWIKGLTFLASHVKKNNYYNVIGFSLRNEVRAPSGTYNPSNTWLKYMAQAADAVHNANNNVLIIAGGLSYATDLSFINDSNNLQKHVTSSILAKTKLLYEAHWYSWSGYSSSSSCKKILKSIEKKWSFIMHNTNRVYTTPIFMSEVGDNIDQFNTNGPSSYYQCVRSFIEKNNLSFATWVVVGSYYYRQGQINMEESFGLLTADFQSIKSQSFQNFIAPVQEKIKPLVWHG